MYRWVEAPLIEVGRRLAARVNPPAPREGERTTPTPSAEVVDDVQIPRPREVLEDVAPAVRG